MITDRPPPRQSRQVKPTGLLEGANLKPPSERMIVLNKKLAKEALANAIDSGRVTDNSSPRAFLLQVSTHLRGVFDMTDDPTRFLPRDFSLDAWDGKEVTAAETIIWLIAYLEKIGCKDIEQLLRDVADYRRRYPDKPKGAWPYVQRSR